MLVVLLRFYKHYVVRGQQRVERARAKSLRWVSVCVFSGYNPYSRLPHHSYPSSTFTFRFIWKRNEAIPRRLSFFKQQKRNAFGHFFSCYNTQIHTASALVTLTPEHSPAHPWIPSRDACCAVSFRVSCLLLSCVSPWGVTYWSRHTLQ